MNIKSAVGWTLTINTIILCILIISLGLIVGAINSCIVISMIIFALLFFVRVCMEDIKIKGFDYTWMSRSNVRFKTYKINGNYVIFYHYWYFNVPISRIDDYGRADKQMEFDSEDEALSYLMENKLGGNLMSEIVL